jgi:hypothetical protein
LDNQTSDSRLRVGIIEYVNIKTGVCRFRDIDTAKVMRFKCPPKELAVALFDPAPGRVLDYLVDAQGCVQMVSQATVGELEAAIEKAFNLESGHAEEGPVWAAREGHHVTAGELHEHLAHFDNDMPVVVWDGAKMNPLLQEDVRRMRYVGSKDWQYLLICPSDETWVLPADFEIDPAE